MIGHNHRAGLGRQSANQGGRVDRSKYLAGGGRAGGRAAEPNRPARAVGDPNDARND